MSLTKSWRNAISIDIPHRRLELDVPDEVLAKRKAKWKPHPPKIDYGYLARYAAQVTSADTGAVFKKPELWCIVS
jgi:dihydroxy-acid dehydratase